MPVPKGSDPVEFTMREYKRGTLHGGAGRHGKVKSRKQAIAIALSRARKGEGSPKRPVPRRHGRQKRRSKRS